MAAAVMVPGIASHRTGCFSGAELDGVETEGHLEGQRWQEHEQQDRRVELRQGGNTRLLGGLAVEHQGDRVGSFRRRASMPSSAAPSSIAAKT
jgi:hypothetical protein